MTELSPAAQAVFDAVVDETRPISEQRELAVDIAAALRAAADQGESLYDPHEGKVSVVRVEHLRAIAAELEGAPDDQG